MRTNQHLQTPSRIFDKDSSVASPVLSSSKPRFWGEASRAWRRWLAAWRVLAVFLLAGSSGLLSMNPAEAAVGKFEPWDGSAYTGAYLHVEREDTEAYKAAWNDWADLMGGKPATLSSTFRDFDDTWYERDLGIAEARNATPLLTWQTKGKGAVTPDKIANAGMASNGKRTDEVILRNARYSVNYGKPMFLRIDQEMNGYWMPWSAYNADGAPRSFTPQDFQKMWKRMVIIFRGGYVRDINAKLAAEDMPPLDANVDLNGAGLGNLWGGTAPSTSDPDAYFDPADKVAFVWTPNYNSNPDTSGNQPVDYYPGDEYVDWVGQDFYNQPWNRPFSEQLRPVLDAFYNEYSVGHGKPYMVGEYGMDPSTGDDPAFIDGVHDWAESKPKVKALVFFSVKAHDGDRRLQAYPNETPPHPGYPNSATALKNRLQASRYLDEITTVDTIPPMVSAPSKDLVYPATLGDPQVPVKLSWSGSDDSGGSGIASYELEQSTNDGAYAPVTLSSPTATSVILNLAPNTYQFRIRAKDNAGNTSEWVYRSAFTLEAYQEASSSVAYTSYWYTLDNDLAFYGRYARASPFAGAKATFTFTGSEVVWVSRRAPNRGIAEVWVDGVKEATVDLYAARNQYRQAVFFKDFGTPGTHKLEVRVLGLKNALSTGTWVDVDGFIVAGRPPS